MPHSGATSTPLLQLSREERKGFEFRLDAAGKVTYAVEGVPASSLDRLWSLLHLSLTLGAAAGAATVDGDVVSHGKPTGTAPDGGASFELRALERRWASAKTIAARRAVLREAIAAYKQQTLPKPDPKRRRGTKEWREAIAGEELSSREVAEKYGVSVRTVFNFRREFKVVSD